MFELLKSIWDMVSGIFKLIVGAIESAIHLLGKLPQLVNFVKSCFVVIPDYAKAFILLALTVIVLYWVINIIRGGD